VAYNIKIKKNKINLLMGYEALTQKVLFGNVLVAALMSARKYDIILQNGDCSREKVRVLVSGNEVFYQNITSSQTPVTSFDELKLRIVAVIERVTLQMLENTWREIEYRLDILHVMKAAHVKAVYHSAELILQIIKFFELNFHIP
jgi:hypothetical protein